MCNCRNFLENLGYKGILLEELLSIINTDDKMEDFKNFILLNDGRFRSSLQLYHMYIIHLRNNSNYTKDEFIKDFNVDNSMALEKVFFTKPNPIALNKVKNLLTDGLTLGELYDNLIKYREFNIVQALQMTSLDFLKKDVDIC